MKKSSNHQELLFAKRGTVTGRLGASEVLNCLNVNTKGVLSCLLKQKKIKSRNNGRWEFSKFETFWCEFNEAMVDYSLRKTPSWKKDLMRNFPSFKWNDFCERHTKRFATGINFLIFTRTYTASDTSQNASDFRCLHLLSSVTWFFLNSFAAAHDPVQVLAKFPAGCKIFGLIRLW